MPPLSFFLLLTDFVPTGHDMVVLFLGKKLSHAPLCPTDIFPLRGEG